MESQIKDTEAWDTHIVAGKSKLSLNLAELYKYKDLLYLFVRRDFVALYKQTVLGPLWFFIQPIVQAFVYTIVFSRMMNLSTGSIPPFLFFLSGMVCWSYFADCLTKTSTTFVANAGVFGKVYFPRLIVPISIVTSNLFKFSVQFVMLICFWFYYYSQGYGLSMDWRAVVLPLIIILLAGFGLGIGLIISAMTTKYRDARFLIGFGVQLWMFLSPVLYPYSSIEGTMQKVLWFNPITHIIELFKDIYVGQGMIDPNGLIYTTCLMFGFLLIGLVLFNRIEKNFMDTV